MVRLAPVDLMVVSGAVAAEVAIPPFDSLTAAERHDEAVRHPLSFLNALPEADTETALEAAARGLERLVTDGAFVPAPTGFHIYRLSDGSGRLTGVVGGLSMEDVLDGRVLPHEDIRPARVAALRRYQERVETVSSPVAMTFRAGQAVSEAIAAVTTGSPDLSFESFDGLVQEVWHVSDGDALGRALADVSALYITDGHHRVAAAAERHREGYPGADHLLVVAFPADELHLHAFHRVVTPVIDVAPLLEGLSRFGLGHVPTGKVVPTEPGWCGVVLGDQSYRFRLPDGEEDLPGRLDPNRLQDAVLAPLLGVDDPARDPRLEPVPGTVPIETVMERARAGAAFFLSPVAMDDFLLVSDMGATMPPKSTYFSPKPRSGVFLHRLG